MKRTAFVLSAMLLATYSVADNASVETTPAMTLAAIDMGHQIPRPATPAARVEQPNPAAMDKTLELTKSVNSQLEQRLAEKLTIEFDLDF